MLDRYANYRPDESERLYALSRGGQVGPRDEHTRVVQEHQRATEELGRGYAHSYARQDDLMRELEQMSRGGDRR